MWYRKRMNYKWQAFLEALKILAPASTNPHKAASIVAVAIENADNIGWQVRSYQQPASDMAAAFIDFQLNRAPAPEWWSHSPNTPEV